VWSTPLLICRNNSSTKSWFHTLKTKHVHDRCYQTRQKAMPAVFECGEAVYNRQRRHSSFGDMTPAQFAAVNQAA